MTLAAPTPPPAPPVAPSPSAPEPTPAPAPAPAPTPKAHRGYVVTKPRARVRHGRALLGLTCAGAGDCAGTVNLVAHRHRDPRVKFVIGRGTFTLPRGQSTTLSIHLNRRGLGLLHLSRKGRVGVRLAGHDLKSASLVLVAHHHKRRHGRRHRGH